MVDQTLNNFLNKLGIEPEAANIYLFLVGKTSQTAHQIAKNTEIPKTTVYRRLEELKTLGLVDEKIDEYKKEYLASPIETLTLLVNKKELETKELVSQLPAISQILSSADSNKDPETKILFYRGKDGIQQMNWNTLKTNGEILGYTYRAWEEIVGSKYIKSFLDEFDHLKMSGRELYSQEYVKSRQIWQDTTKKWPRWETRFINPKILDINHQVDIYNDVVAIYNWHDGEVFGVEIHNPKVAKMQKQIFEVLWKLGKPKKASS